MSITQPIGPGESNKRAVRRPGVASAETAPTTTTVTDTAPRETPRKTMHAGKSLKAPTSAKKRRR